MDTPSTHQPLQYRSDVQRLAGTPAPHNIWGYSLMFGAGHFSAAAHILIPAPTHRLRHPTTSPSSSPGQPMQPASAPCSSRHNQSVPSTHPSRGATTSATPASPSASSSSMPLIPSQSWCSLAAIAAVVECSTTDSAPPRTPVTCLTMLRLAMCGYVNPRAWATRCAAMRVTRHPRNKTGGAKCMAPAMGRPSSSVAQQRQHPSHPVRDQRWGNCTSGALLTSHGYSVYTPTTAIPIRRAASGRNARSAQHLGIFTHVRCGALLRSSAHPNSCSNASAPPSHNFTIKQPRSADAASVSSVQQPAQPISTIHTSLAWRHDQCDSSVPISIQQLHAINI
ncbi:hypothetical protein MOQ_009407, partial [Trypanosoma cruzi marinkellei]